MCCKKDNCSPSSCSCRGGKIERFIEPCLLLLLKKNQPSHGYELLDNLNAFGLNNDPGSVYRTLRRLENEQMVKSSWDTEGTGPAKRLYELSPEGEKLLADWITNFKNTRKNLDKFIKEYQDLEG
ncbi:MAG: helix-turn-helix transcriptional regulator [Bacillota bacterium]